MSRGESGAPRRGEVWWVAFDPSVGGEIKKTRPAIVVSNDIANRLLNRVQVVPVTHSVTRLYPAEAFVTVKAQRARQWLIRSRPRASSACVSGLESSTR